MSDIVPRSEVSRQGVKGVGALAGGAALIVLSLLGPILGFITGGVLTVVGFALTGSKPDRTAGFITAGAGLVTIVSALHRFVPVFPNLDWLMWIPGIGLLAIGAVSLVRFFGNLKKRS
ncbi:MAG: hypothetical protein ABSG17_12080 [Spirochaetia bacterium]|jgi:uncharacterized membrane protein